jgi:hypothetical protein
MEQLVEEKTPSTSTPTTERIRGVGDVVAKVTKAVGIKPCPPCQKRRQWLNKYFPIK